MMKLQKKSLLTFLFSLYGLQRYHAFTTPTGRTIVDSRKSFNPGMHNSRDSFEHRGRRSPSGKKNTHRKHPRRKHRQTENRDVWLTKATQDILDTRPGTLGKGKWHELTSMAKAWSRYSKTDPETPLILERLIKRLLDERRAGNAEAKATIEMYNILLDAWACFAIFQSNKVGAQRARELLVNLQQNYETEQDTDLQPNKESFGFVLDAVLRTEGPTNARRVLVWMEYLYRVGRNEYSEPSRKMYIRLLDAYANSRNENAGQAAEGVLRQMNMAGTTPDTLSYNIAIKAWTRAKRGRESAEHADWILEEMEAPKDIVTYATVISAWAVSGMKSHAVARAEELLKEIEDHPDLEPNTVVLNTVMSTWVKSRNPEASKRTAQILRRMEASKAAQPDLISYNTHIHALSIHSGTRPGNAKAANDLLNSLEERAGRRDIPFKPNLFTYNLVIDAWSRSNEYDAAWNAVKVLRKLIADDGQPDPDTFSFNQVFAALSRSTRKGATGLAVQLLNYMEDAHRLGIYKRVKPDVVGYTSVIVTLARSNDSDAAERAESLLNSLKERYAAGEIAMKPTRIIFNALIDCWAKSGKGTYAARKAEALLQEMNEMGASGDITVSPNIVTYNAVLNSWARSGTRCCANKAEQYLARMWELYDSGGGQIAPNDKSFNTVINAISKSPINNKAQKALRMLRRMDKLYQDGYKNARPTEVTYTSVLNSCAFPATLDQKTRRKALDTAIFTLQELQTSRYGQPNEVTYGTFIKACSNLCSDDEMLREMIEDAFQQCIRDGQVGEMVLSHLRDAAPDDLYQELLAEALGSDARVSIDNLPPEWRCNVGVENSWNRRNRPIPPRGDGDLKTQGKLTP